MFSSQGTNLDKLCLNDNPVRCCEVGWLRALAALDNTPCEATVCAGPTSLAGQQLRSIASFPTCTGPSPTTAPTTAAPSNAPTDAPSAAPTVAPSAKPTSAPSAPPTTAAPSAPPTTAAPSSPPTDGTAAPSLPPSAAPRELPPDTAGVRRSDEGDLHVTPVAGQRVFINGVDIIQRLEELEAAILTALGDE